MTKTLGIDPGSQVTGFGIIGADGACLVHIASGCIQVHGPTLAIRLRTIFEGVSGAIASYRPDEVAIEQVFVHRNADSALKLGQARGAAMCAVAIQALPIFEYTPRAIKQAVVGKGSAAKEQIQYMVRVLLNLTQPPAPDAADALAVALCHAHQQHVLSQVATQGSVAQGSRRGRWR